LHQLQLLVLLLLLQVLCSYPWVAASAHVW
jgi:hypothetical protein